MSFKPFHGMIIVPREKQPVVFQPTQPLDTLPRMVFQNDPVAQVINYIKATPPRIAGCLYRDGQVIQGLIEESTRDRNWNFVINRPYAFPLLHGDLEKWYGPHIYGLHAPDRTWLLYIDHEYRPHGNSGNVILHENTPGAIDRLLSGDFSQGWRMDKSAHTVGGAMRDAAKTHQWVLENHLRAAEQAAAAASA